MGEKQTVSYIAQKYNWLDHCRRQFSTIYWTYTYAEGRVPQPRHCWYFGSDNSLLLGVLSCADRVFSTNCGPLLLYASYTPLVATNKQKCLQILPNVYWEWNILQLRTTVLEQAISLSVSLSYDIVVYF